MVEKARRRPVAQMPDVLEVGLVTVVGVGDLPRAGGVPLAQQVDFSARTGAGGPAAEFCGVGLVHGDQQIEPIVVRLDQGPGPMGDLQAVTPGTGPGPRVGGLTLVVPRCPRRVDNDEVLKPCLGNGMGKNHFGQRRPANVPETDKQNVHGCAENTPTNPIQASPQG